MVLRWKTKIAEGVSIHPTGRDSFEYRDGGRTMQVVAELLAGRPERVIYISSISRWNPPFEGEELVESRRTEILSGVKKFFEINKVSYEVQ